MNGNKGKSSFPRKELGYYTQSSPVEDTQETLDSMDKKILLLVRGEWEVQTPTSPWSKLVSIQGWRGKGD